VKLLLENSADVHAKDKKDKTAIHKSADWGYSKVTKELLKHGADPYALNIFGTSAIFYASTEFFCQH